MIESTWDRAWMAFGLAAAAQLQHQAASEPTRRFLELLGAILANGNAHLASTNGEEPANPVAFGWREETLKDDVRWVSRGERIGWVDGDGLYLEPDAAYAAVQRLARTSGDAFVISLATLKRRLHERGLLASVELPGMGGSAAA